MWPGRARAAKRAEFRVFELHQTCRWQCFLCWCFSASTSRVNDQTPSIKRVCNKLSSGTTHAPVERCRTLWEDRRNRFPACVGIPTRVRKTTVRTTPVRSQQCECQQCERVNSANANSANATAVRMPAVRMRQQCERRFSELCKTVPSVETT